MTSTIKVNTIQNTCGADIIKESGNTITIGASGDTVTLGSGASQTGFGREGSVDWQTGSIKTSTFTAVSGEGYFVDTSSGAVTMNLPAGVAGAIVAVADYTRTFNDNTLTISPNGSNKIGGVAQDSILSVNGQAATFVFVDATEGWINVQNAEDTETGAPPFIVATGGTVTTCGDFKIHTFTGPGTLSVTAVSPSAPSNILSQVIVGGGGGGAAGRPGNSHVSGAGGAGGFREESNPADPYVPNDSPLAAASSRALTVADFPITVGAGGTGQTQPACSTQGGNGSSSTGIILVSAGGGGGGSPNDPQNVGLAGGSGGGGGSQSNAAGGAGNTPPVSPPQGNNGGQGTDGPAGSLASGGGGGASANGSNSSAGTGGAGGAGVSTSITGSAVTRAGGGGGTDNSGGPGSNGGSRGGGAGGDTNGVAGTANTGGGGGGSRGNGGAGGSGVVIIRYKFQ